MTTEKKRKLQLILVSILALIALFFVLTNTKGTIKKELRDFAVSDTSLVDRIFIVDKENNQVLIEKQPGYWSLNTNYVARQDLVDILLKTIYRIRVKEPVANAAKETIIKNLAVKSTKVEVYSKGELIKVFYVGGPTQDSYGTYMILENSSSPFIVEIPGFRGYLSTRFSTFENDWKAQVVFNYPITAIAEVTLQHIANPENSFRITHANNHFELVKLETNIPELNFDTIQVKKYLMEYKQKNFNKYIEDVPEKWQDSIKESNPMYVVSLITNSGDTAWIKAFSKPAWGYKNAFGDDLSIDPDNFFMELSNGDFVYGQYFVFDPIFRPFESFLKD